MDYEFNDKQQSVVVHRHNLPTPWINYLSNGTLHAFISHAGGGLAWWKSPSKARLTRYRMGNLPTDTPGFYIYIRESDGTVWSPTFRPVETKLDSWRAEHQPGLTRFEARRGSLTAVLEFFIPPETNVVVWDLLIENSSNTDVELDIFGYVEFSLMDWKQDTDWSCYVKHNLDLQFDSKTNGIIYLYRHFHFNPWLAKCPLAYFGASAPVVSYTTDRDGFVGAYRWENNPVSVEQNKCNNTDLYCGEPCGALQTKMLVKACARERQYFFLGAEPDAIVDWPRARNSVQAVMNELRRDGNVEGQKRQLKDWWKEHLDTLQFELPDADVERQVNTWNPLQCVHTGRYSRSISTFASGIRTLGFRDTCQDMLAIAYRKPQWATDVFLYLISQLYEDGHAPHQCNPVENLPAEPRVHIDNALWLPILAHAILAETGDLRLLQAKLPWLSKEDNISQVGSASVWEHLFRISDFVEANLGLHGLPLTHKGDWNDSIGKFSKLGRGESLMAAQQYVYALTLLADIAAALNLSEQAEELKTRKEKQSAAILGCAWDGSWWRRGFDDEGAPIGTASATYGQLWLNTQSWAVIAGVGTVDQHGRALQSVKDLLDTEICGLKKLHPSYPSFPQANDPYSGYSPGCGENGAIFCHANTWAIIAEAIAGNSDRAWSYYRQLVPHIALNRIGLERYQAEPYAYVSNIVGPENPRFGWANVSQVTGTATWMDIAVTQYLLGIRPEISGLRIDPRIPSGWPGFKARRKFRGRIFEISFECSGRKGGTAKEIRIDGELLNGNLIKISDQKENEPIHVVVNIS